MQKKTLWAGIISIVSPGLLYGAMVVGFELGEDYNMGELDGQPSSGTAWERTNGHPPVQIRVSRQIGVNGSMGLENIQAGGSNHNYYRLQPTNEDLGGSFNANSSVVSYGFQWKLNEEHFGSTNPNAVFKFTMGGTDRAARDSFMQIDVRNGGRFFVWHGGAMNAVEDGMFKPGTWHSISGTINYAENTFTVLVDGIQQFRFINGGNLPFRSDSVKNANVYIGNLNASAASETYLNWHFDNLELKVME